MSTRRIPDHLRFWEPEADRLLLAFVQEALDAGGTVLDGCQRFVQALQAAGPRVTPSPEQMAMRWEVLQTFGGDPARDPGAAVGLARPAPPRAGAEQVPLLPQLADELHRLADELHRLARRLEQAATQRAEGQGPASAQPPTSRGPTAGETPEPPPAPPSTAPAPTESPAGSAEPAGNGQAAPPDAERGHPPQDRPAGPPPAAPPAGDPPPHPTAGGGPRNRGAGDRAQDPAAGALPPRPFSGDGESAAEEPASGSGAAGAAPDPEAENGKPAGASLPRRANGTAGRRGREAGPSADGEPGPAGPARG